MSIRKWTMIAALSFVSAFAAVSAEKTDNPVKEQPKATAANSVKDQEIIKVLPPPRVPATTVRDIPLSRLKASATSQRNDYTVPAKAVDGDLSQGWLSELGSLKTKGPQSLTLEMDNVYTVDAMRYFLTSTPQSDPKREYVNWISRIQKYEISVSLDGKTFQSVASGEWDKTDLNEQRVFFTPVQARFVKLTAFVGGNDNAGATEVSLESPNPPKPLGTFVPPPANAATRRAAFEQRDNMDRQKEIVWRLAKMAQRNNPELSAFFAAKDKGDATAALAAFNRAVIDRMKKFATLLDVEKPATPPMGISEEMLANIISAPQLKSKFEVGEPGTIYWNAPEILTELKAKGNRALTPEMFDPLLASYRQFGNESYFQKWAAYMDDMLLNDRGYRDMNSFTMMDGDCWGPRRIRWFFTQLLQVEQARPGSLEHLPIGLLPRIFTEMVPDHVALGAAYFHANAQNWTHHASVEWLKAGAFLDGLIVMDVPLTERTLRMLETYETCSNLPDGTEAEQAMWYNWGWVGSVLEFLHTVDAIGKIEPSCISLDAARRAELEESILRRIRYCAQIYTQNGEWPLFLRGDNRKLWGLGSLKKDNHELHAGAGMQPLGSYNERILNDPAIAPVLGAIGPEKETGIAPSYTSNYFPWGGYRIIRENWDPQSQYGSMFSSPKPGKYWARGGSEHLSFGLHAFGQDLLVDDAKGHYSGFSSPVMVDGKNQAYRVGYPVWGHKQILLNGWEKPDSSRFLSSTALEFMEGTYAGPYGEANAHKPEEIAAENAAAIRGVVHGRQIIFIREAGIWIVTDRLKGDKPHTYTWRWMLPSAPAGVKFFAYQPSEIVLDKTTNTISTSKPEGANLYMRTFTNAKLDFKRSERSKAVYEYYGAKDNPWNSICEIQAKTNVPSEVLAVTAILPLQTDKIDFKTLSPNQSEVFEGFSADTPDGSKIIYAAARKGSATLTASAVKADAETLLTVEKNGRISVLTLGCAVLSINGERINSEYKDFTFSLQSSNPATRSSLLPLNRPIELVKIEPTRNVFIGKENVTLYCPTSGTEIRYTVDGSEPTRNSALYREPFTISKTTMIKSKAYRTGCVEKAGELDFTAASPTSLAILIQEKPREAVKVAETAPGLRATYYDGEWKKLFVSTALADPAGTGVVPKLLDISLRKNTGPFTFVYEGLLNVPETGVYTFNAPFEFMDNKIDNGYDLVLEIDGERWQPATRRHAFGNWSIALAKGHHKLRLKYLDYRGNRIEMSTPNWPDEVKVVEIDYSRKGPSPRNFPGMNGDYVWGGGVPELLVRGPGLEKQPIPGAWLSH